MRKPACCRCHPTRTAAAIRVQVDGDDLFRRGKDRSGCSRETAAATNTDRRVSLRSRPIMAKGALLPRCADHVGWALRAPNKADLTVLEFNSFGAHIGSGYGGADMPLTGPIPEGRTFFCPHCGALYSVTYSRLSKSDSNIAKCVVCLQIMTSWDSTKIPIYKLVQRPEDA